MAAEYFKILIAHNDPKTCAFLVENINYEQSHSRLICVVTDENSLLQITDVDIPNIIITNIFFFKRHGVSLSNKAAERHTECKFIIIFEENMLSLKDLYALPLKVDYFLQMPLDADELNETLILLNHSMAKPGSFSVTEPEYYKLYRSLQRLYLLRTLQGEIVPTNPSAVEHEYGISFRGDYFQCCTFKFDSTARIPELNFTNFSPLLSKIFRFLRKRLPEEASLISCTENYYFYIVISFEKEIAHSVLEKINETFAVARNSVSAYRNLSITLGLSRVHKTLPHLKSALYEAKSATYFRLLKGVNRTINYSDIVQLPRCYSPSESSALLQELEQIFRLFDRPRFCNILDNIFSDISNPIELVEFLLSTGKLLFAPELLPKNVDHETNIQQRHTLFLGIQNATSYPQLKSHVQKSIATVLSYRAGLSDGCSAKPIRDAILFIHAHYAEQLSLERVATQVALHPVYFSNLFKKETGETFVNYLNNYRIEKSKEFLLKTTDTISEIAYSLGFNDPKYFSRLFRKYIGMSPLEFRSVYG